MKTTWIDIVNRLVRTVGCWVVAGLMVWRGWTCADPQGVESIMCCCAGLCLGLTGIAVGTGGDRGRGGYLNRRANSFLDG